MIPLGVCILVFKIHGCRSLKEKRGIIKPVLTDLRKHFNLSVAEVDYQDAWQDSVIACAMVGSDRIEVERSLQAIPEYCEKNFRYLQLVNQEIEIL